MHAKPLLLNRRNLLAGLGVGAAITIMPTGATAQPLSLAIAINREARLRALSQRVTKAYAQLVLGVTPEDSAKVLAAAMRIIESNLSELGKAQFSGDVQAAVTKARGDAERLLALARARPEASRLAEINGAAETLLQSSDRATAAIEAGRTQARIINTAGRQRMLSQRMAKAYMLAEAGVDSAAMRKQLADSRVEFNQALAGLETAPVSTDAIKGRLQIARGQWLMMQAALDGGDRATARRDVATTSERLLEVMDDLTNRYEVAMRDLLGAVSAYRPVFASDTQGPLA